MSPQDSTDESGFGTFSPNAVSSHEGQKECNHRSGCRSEAQWDIELIDRRGCKGLKRACDEHVEDIWGYHPGDSA